METNLENIFQSLHVIETVTCTHNATINLEINLFVAVINEQVSRFASRNTNAFALID